jgi:hypothetical protein
MHMQVISTMQPSVVKSWLLGRPCQVISTGHIHALLKTQPRDVVALILTMLEVTPDKRCRSSAVVQSGVFMGKVDYNHVATPPNMQKITNMLSFDMPGARDTINDLRRRLKSLASIGPPTAFDQTKKISGQNAHADGTSPAGIALLPVPQTQV